MTQHVYSQISLLFPEKGLVYDYQLDDGGITKAEKRGDVDLDDDEVLDESGKVGYFDNGLSVLTTFLKIADFLHVLLQLHDNGYNLFIVF